jgi:predicted nucleic acid-binding protein
LKRFVLDASVALAWFVDNPIPPFAQNVERRLVHGEKAFVPALWLLEVANGLIVAERRGKLSFAQCALAIEKVRQLLSTVVDISSAQVSLRQNFETARDFNLTAYDATYLNAARSEHLPLATLDRQLLEAAIKARIEILS